MKHFRQGIEKAGPGSIPIHYLRQDPVPYKTTTDPKNTS